VLVDHQPIFTRAAARVHLEGAGNHKDADFIVDPHLVALPIIPQRFEGEPLSVVKQWLSRMLILRPVPGMILGDSKEGTLEPVPSVTNFGSWFSGLIAHAPAAYSQIDDYLKQVMPDFKDIKNFQLGRDYRGLVAQFSSANGTLAVPFGELSDGEKCFMICAMVLAMNEHAGPIFCFWDELDSHLSISEVSHFVMTLRRAFHSRGQFVATSHNSEVIHSFADENTFYFHRKSHLEPPTVRPLSEMKFEGDLVTALTLGDLEP
jgi:hypothetical protein